MLSGAAGQVAAAQRWDPGPGDEGVLAAHCATRLGETQGRAPKKKPSIWEKLEGGPPRAPGGRALAAGRRKSNAHHVHMAALARWVRRTQPRRAQAS